jgi:hypothetical protein
MDLVPNCYTKIPQYFGLAAAVGVGFSDTSLGNSNTTQGASTTGYKTSGLGLVELGRRCFRHELGLVELGRRRLGLVELGRRRLGLVITFPGRECLTFCTANI